MERFKTISSSYLILIKNRKILLLRRFRTGYEDGKYSLPAWHVEEGETLREAAAREIKEEIGLLIKPEDFELVHIMHRKGDDIRVDFFFTAKKWKGVPANMELNKCDDLRWFSLTKLPVNTIPYIRKAITNYQEKILYSEVGF